jgi:hypothetical protein
MCRSGCYLAEAEFRAASTVNVTVSLDTKVAHLLLNALGPLVRDGVLSERDFIEIVNSTIRIEAR